jgi:serine/threonine protein kinase
MDQRTNIPDGSRGQQPPQFDKTFVEGADVSATRTPLSSGARVDATSIRASNPYDQGGGEITDINSLPSGKEPIPIGSGVIVELLGTGGMARVYKIWNEKLEVFRAVKILIPGRGSDLKNRFDTESKITAKLHHPNIVEIYNVGEWRGLPYIEMEFIDGCSIEALITKNGRLPTAVCSAIAIFVARALVYAHGQTFLLYGKTYHGVIHRDLKPPNIMISLNGEVRLMDFGIARPTEVSLHTVEGNIVGTMQYLSPEQIDCSEIDSRSDLYSFGAILYEMLTGTKTFPQETITNLMKKKIINEYRKFSDFDFTVAPALSRIAQRCLQSEKESRYPSAADLLEHLEEAHKSLTSDEPDVVLGTYLKDPERYVSPDHTKTIRFPTLKISKHTITIAAAAALGAIAIGVGIGIFAHGSASDTKLVSHPDTLAKVVTNPAPPVDTAHAIPHPSPGTVDTTGLKPLDGKSHGGTTVAINTTTTPPPKPPVIPPKPLHPAPTPAVTRQPAITLADLAKSYGTSDPAAIARNALKGGHASEAIIALESSADNTVDPKLKTLLLFEAYIDAGRMREASLIAGGPNPQDAQFDYLSGRLFQLRGKNESALEMFESSLTKPSITRKRNDIRDDALYYTAIVRSDVYRKDPSADSREQAANAWTVVKRLYSGTPDSPRYKKASDELTALK